MRGKVILACTSALLGALLALIISGALRHSKPSASTPEKFIPAQTLRLTDKRGSEFATLSFLPERWFVLDLFDSGNPLASLTSGGLLTLHGSLTGNSTGGDIQISRLFDRIYITVMPPDGKSKDIPSRLWPRSRGLVSDLFLTAKVIIRGAYRRIVPKEPEVLDSLIPTQDLRLTDKGGHTFAVLGLSAAGDPTMVILDNSGTILAQWELFERKWSGIKLYDGLGHGRFAVELRPGHPPALSIFEEPDVSLLKDSKNGGYLGVYTIDPGTYEEVPVENPLFEAWNPAGEISWLRFPKSEVIVPIVLLDQRNEIVWRAP